MDLRVSLSGGQRKGGMEGEGRESSKEGKEMGR